MKPAAADDEPTCIGPAEACDYGDDPNFYNKTEMKRLNEQICTIYKNPAFNDLTVRQCKDACADKVDEAKQEGYTTNYGCMGFFPLEKSIPWVRQPGAGREMIVGGTCLCDNWVLNELADTVLEALPIIAQVSHVTIPDQARVSLLTGD